MKKIMAIALAICMLCLSAGCAKKENKEESAVPTAQIAYASYQYEEGYQLAEGWMYEMTISSGDQLDELGRLVDGLKLTVRDELFDHDRGYYLAFSDAEGSMTRELLILEDGSVSQNGMVFDADGAEALLTWLEALKIEEQDVE